MNDKIIVHWFRQDLRIRDNPSFSIACDRGQVMPIYILDTHCPKNYQLGNASKWWLHHSLISLQNTLKGNLLFFMGDPKIIISSLIDQYKISAVNWNRCYMPWEIKRDQEITKLLMSKSVEVHTYNGSLLWEPWKILKQDGTPYKVFTSFYKKGCLSSNDSIRRIVAAPKKINYFLGHEENRDVNKLNLLPSMNWHLKLHKYWEIGETAALEKFNNFSNAAVYNYKEGRDYPGENYVSRLSPHIRFGEISPNYIWYKVNSLKKSRDTEHFLSEIGWREFSYNLIFHFPSITHDNLQTVFNNFPWNKNEKYLNAWKHGKTGYPIVDAGMKQLWEEGYMHNRVRMIAASFLTKNLLLNWKLGERWFWDCLVDADLANNSASWQWVAGSGADAAPYFRVFNPILQGEKFDEDGKYTKKYLPQLINIPKKYLFCPWIAPRDVLEDSGIKLGENYPYPLVDLNQSRTLALESYNKMKQG